MLMYSAELLGRLDEGCEGLPGDRLIREYELH